MRTTSLPYALGLSAILAMACGDDTTSPTITGTETGGSSSSSSSTTSAESSTSSSTTSEEESSSSSSGASSGSGTAAESSSSEEAGIGSICNDGDITGIEECDCGGAFCDMAALNFTRCEDLPRNPALPGIYTGGRLGCSAASCRFDASQCTYCGDGEINGNEVCELSGPIGTTCGEQGVGNLGEVTCTDSCTFDTTACDPCGFLYTFNGCPNEGWTSVPAIPAAQLPPPLVGWNCGNTTGYTGGPGTGTTGVWATNISGPYAANESEALLSPPLDLTTCGGATLTLTLTHWLNLAPGVPEAKGDGGILQASTDDGLTWTTVTPTGGLGYDAEPPNFTSTWPPLHGALAGFSYRVTQRQWLDTTFDLSPFAGQTLRLRFVFGSDTNAAAGGWYIDELFISSLDKK